MGSPYRELPKYLLCPRCGEMLSRVFEGVSSCLRCEGLWIAPATLDAAFGNPRWPAGQVLWWRNSIDCPQCTFEGKQTLMTARMSNDVLVDQCPDHGVWLDRGELGRLMGTEHDELSALRERLAVVAPDLDRLVARREKWRSDLEHRRQAAVEYRQALEDEHRRQTEVATAERARRASEPPRPSPPARPTPPRSPARTSDLPHAEVETRRRAADRRQALGTERAQAAATAAQLQDQLAALRDHMARLDAELATTRQRADGLARELDATRARLSQLDAELDAPG